jgi:hypothetical protein
VRGTLALVLVVTGTWAMNFIYRDGTHTQGYCSFKQDGNTVTGRCGPEVAGGSPVTGEITNNEMTWQVEEGPAYKAVLDEGGVFMRGTFSVSGDGLFTAMKTR